LPKVTQEQADKSFKDSFDVGLYYIPIYKAGILNNWVLGYRPLEQSLYPVDAQTGKRIDNDGSVLTSVPVTYSDVPVSKNNFKSSTLGRELTGEEAATLVKKVVSIPADRKLISQSESNDYQNKDRKIWRLMWGTNDRFANGFPTQSYAEVDANTGEILQFQVEQYGMLGNTKPQPAPAGVKKISLKESKQRALELVSQMYDKASTNLKLVEHGEDWNLNPDKTGYRYQFAQFYKGIPVSDNMVTINLDLYGKIQSYSSIRNMGIDKVTQEPVAAISKKEALNHFLSQYTLKLQYNRVGGYNGSNINVEPGVKLVYALTPKDIQTSATIMDATTGKEVTVYDTLAMNGTAAAATDLKGHSAEKELSELVKYNVITPDAAGKVNPDQEITVGDWITLIARASTPYFENYNSGAERKTIAGVNPENPYFSAVSFAVERDWISRDSVVQTDSKLTREQLAVLLTSFIRYAKLSAFLEKDITVNQFSDSSSITNKGAVALVVKLGLMKDDNGKFNPQGVVTKAQAAMVIMKLVELQGKVDQKLGQYSPYY